MIDTQAVETALRSALRDGVGKHWTAAVVQVRCRYGDEIAVAEGTPDPATETPALPDQVFDLASLTKPFTASAALRTIAAGALELDTPIDQFDFPYSGVTVQHLLTHTSGLPAHARLQHVVASRKDPWDDLRSRALEQTPGSRVVYSDVGYLILGRVLELAAGQPLDEILQEHVCTPLGLRSVRFGPRPSAAATEYVPSRGGRIRGVVHDESAAVLGGVAGHAGLFGTAEDVLALTSAYTSHSSNFLPAWLRESAIDEQGRADDVRWGLGWKLRSESELAAETALSPAAFGHYGFTGTSVWHDPCGDLTVCLLTNRVYFGRDPVAIWRLRKAIHQTAANWSRHASRNG